jgi:plasmid stabilization system protein ParE
MAKITVNKTEAATRQLDEAIELLFADHDPLAIRTLAAAAHGVFADLVEVSSPGESWRTRLIEESGLSKKDALASLNSAQNFLKHADRDPSAKLSFEEEENDDVIFIATIECGQLGQRLSFNMQVFQIWYLASYPEKLGSEVALVMTARAAFPELHTHPREMKLSLGREFLEKLRVQYGGDGRFCLG